MSEKTRGIAPDKLLFDVQNPRLALELIEHGDETLSDVQIIQYLDDEANLQELITSIAENGFIPFEPLIVIVDIADGDKFKVLEGNRRLAAVKLILDTDLRARTGVRVDEEFDAEKLATMDKLPTYEVTTEEDAAALIGFKHIKGAYKWNSFAKAKYVTDQYKQGQDIIDIAEKIGDGNQTVRNLVCGMLVLEQAIENGLFDISNRTKAGPFGLSHLYTALGRSEYQKFLGLVPGWDKPPSKEGPVPLEKYDELKEMLTYIYGSRESAVSSLIKSQNPDLKNLGKTLACDEGLKQLRAGAPLEVAFAETQEDDVVFANAIRQALNAVNHALGNVTKYDGQDESIVMTAQKISRGAESISNTVELVHKKHLEKNS